MGFDNHTFLKELGLEPCNVGSFNGKWLKSKKNEQIVSFSPIDDKEIAKVTIADDEIYEEVIQKATDTFKRWRMLPAPKRGEVIRKIGLILRDNKKLLGRLISLEMGKILSEGEGEVQEAIDVADFAVGLSRQLYGKTIASERDHHRMYEQWQPLGVTGVITAFNFPMSVWSWNAMIAMACGDVVVWKPSSKTPLIAIAIHKLIQPVLGEEWEGVLNIITGRGETIGEKLINDKRIPLISFTGSCSMGKKVSEVVGKRLGRSILELGGNNAIIITASTNLELALKAVLFAALGTSGQRCTSLRRVIIDKKISKKFIELLIKAYSTVKIGNPLEEGILMGPLVDENAVNTMKKAVSCIEKQGGKILYKGLGQNNWPGHCYVEPVIALAKPDMEIVREETFAPILYILEYDNLEQAIHINNDVPQGLSSAIFTSNLYEAETFLCAEGSDCGIANVNIGTSGAEIGGAFGGEKETGGGRECGSDAWKAYMRRQTVTINFGKALPLAQGVKFEIQ